MTAPQADPYPGAEVVPLADSEKALIALVRARDQQAFRRLYDQHVNWIHALCYRLTGNRAQAEEATQEVFLRIWHGIDSFKGDSRFRTWLHSVASNTTLSYLRQQRPWHERLFGGQDDDAPIAGKDLLAEAETDLGRLDRLLPHLPERARAVFVLHAIEGYRHEEVARALKITPGASKAHFHRARVQISQWLEDDS